MTEEISIKIVTHAISQQNLSESRVKSWDEYTCSVLPLCGQTLRLAANSTAA